MIPELVFTISGIPSQNQELESQFDDQRRICLLQVGDKLRQRSIFQGIVMVFAAPIVR